MSANHEPNGVEAGGVQTPVQNGTAKKSFAKRYGFPLTLLALCVVLAGFLLWNQASAKSGKLPDQGAAADFTYDDIQGNKVTMSELDGKVRLVYFFFSNCPDVCPPTTFMLSQVQDKLKEQGKFGDKVEILSITIDPKRDTPEALKTFGDKFHADYTGWKFLRGEEAATAELAKKYQLMVYNDNGNFGHSNLVVLVDKKGRMREFISPQANGNPGDYSADDLVNDINKLL